MTQEEKQLLKIDICARLPYGLKAQFHYNKIIGEVNSVYGLPDYEDIKIAIGMSDGEHIWMFSPILRPLSDLYAEITHAGYNDGKPFVPLIECAKIFEPEVDWRLERIGEYEYRAIDDEDRYFGYSSGEFYHYIWGGVWVFSISRIRFAKQPDDRLPGTDQTWSGQVRPRPRQKPV